MKKHYNEKKSDFLTTATIITEIALISAFSIFMKPKIFTFKEGAEEFLKKELGSPYYAEDTVGVQNKFEILELGGHEWWKSGGFYNTKFKMVSFYGDTLVGSVSKSHTDKKLTLHIGGETWEKDNARMKQSKYKNKDKHPLLQQ